MISYFSSCACFTDRRKFPTFFRVIPNDDYQVKAIAQLLIHFNWTWVGLVRGDHEYGRFAVQGLLQELQGTQVCVAYQEMIPLLYNRKRALEIMQVMRSSLAKVVVVFSAEGEMTPFLRDYMNQNITGIQWVASEAWVTASVFTGSEYYPFLGGTIGFGIRKGHIQKLWEYLQTVNPQQYPDNVLVHELWEALYGCSSSQSFGSRLPSCSGQELLLEQHSAYMNTSSPRVAYNVYKAVYAVAHSLHNLLLCQKDRGPFLNNSCAQSNNIHPWQLQHYLQEVTFDIDGEEVNFDLKGDSIPYYDVINWQRGTGGNIEFVNVGLFDGTKSAGEELVIQDSAIMYAGHQSKVPVSICSTSCFPGYRKAVRRGEPLCCFDCVPCDTGKISNQTNSVDCTFCPEDFWSNENRTACISKKVEFLAYDTLGIILTLIAVVGACLTMAVFAVFFYHRNTAIVRVNNSELSFFILFALTLCFLCCLVFIGEPTVWSCMLRHTAFSITFSLCISCILGKTLVVLAAFTATRPGDNIMKWLGPKQQRAIIFGSTAVQVIICVAWLIDAPPYPSRNTEYERSKIILECSVGSNLAFWCVLGYIGLQACLCFVLAFLARKLPGNFNEAKFITFSMLIFCAVWLAFIPAYISSPGNYADAVESFAILASGFGLLFCLFAPKCYIILLKPEKNTKQHLMGKEKKHSVGAWLDIALSSVTCSQACFLIYLFFFYSSSSCSSSLPPSCNLQKKFILNEMHKPGDVVLGGLFELHLTSVLDEGTFTSEPQQPHCSDFNILGFRHAMTMAFAVEEINKNANLLPNVTLGYSLYDNCGGLLIGLSAAISLASGREEQFVLQQNCSGIPPVIGIVGETQSTFSIAISNVLGLYKMPIVSYYATCSCLSDQQRFPTFFRTIPSDAFQVRAMIKILKYFGWTWVGLLISGDDYGLHVAQSFQSDLLHSGGGCLAYLEVLPWEGDQNELRRIVELMKTSTARVVMVFAHEIHMIQLMKEVVRQNLTGLQWIASEAWSAASVLQTPVLMPYLRGTLGIAIRRGEIPGLMDFLLQIHPEETDNKQTNMVRQYWEYVFQCKFKPTEKAESSETKCTGQEQINNVETEFLDLSNLRPEYNIYKAVYALAYALHNMLQCEPGRGPFSRNSCANQKSLELWQMVHYLTAVNFTTSFGDQVSFDENGDAIPIYDIMNWQWLPDGRTEVVNVGDVKGSESKGEELLLHEDKIFWNFESKKPPRSVCSESCPAGTRMARKKGQPVCCYDCVPCPEGKISNQSNSLECKSCPSDFWSSPQRDHCVLKKTEFLSYNEPLGICLTTSSLLGTFICVVILGVFIHHRQTPMVRANNSELSFLLLVSLKFCFLCSLLFIGQPRLWTCQLRHAAFGISFVLCVSCILVKTVVVVAVFKASKPGGGASLKWFGAMQQRGTVFLLTSIQAAICTVWLVSSSPAPHKNTQYHKDKIVYECVVGSTVGFAVLLGYIGLLALLSFLLAFLARNLPDNFNEAKLITFSMLIFCAVWVAFVPAYINSPGKYADAVEVFAILASSFGLLMALFGPKCYIILLRPERNTKKVIMGRKTNKT
ncbi:extracellular calcium-sensing receptor-like [Gouania willdenowi]|uniref:extracellular calcium-sensing receptor-like n=1 Tax=Gouania willdenowi TaxID=441366 RepID=UPI0010558108|nr:extracellular calcium-sensing receptor-like [Gouania willdenowi]